MIQTLRTGLLILSATLILTSCNTIQGVGKDIKQGGQALENAATSGHSSTQNSQKTTTKTSTSTQTTTTAQ